MRQQGVDHKRHEDRAMLATKRERQRQMGLGRQERYWLRKQQEERAHQTVWQALAQTPGAL